MGDALGGGWGGTEQAGVEESVGAFLGRGHGLKIWGGSRTWSCRLYVHVLYCTRILVPLGHNSPHHGRTGLRLHSARPFRQGQLPHKTCRRRCVGAGTEAGHSGSPARLPRSPPSAPRSNGGRGGRSPTPPAPLLHGGARRRQQVAEWCRPPAPPPCGGPPPLTPLRRCGGSGAWRRCGSRCCPPQGRRVADARGTRERTAPPTDDQCSPQGGRACPPTASPPPPNPPARDQTHAAAAAASRQRGTARAGGARLLLCLPRQPALRVGRELHHLGRRVCILERLHRVLAWCKLLPEGGGGAGRAVEGTGRGGGGEKQGKTQRTGQAGEGVRQQGCPPCPHLP